MLATPIELKDMSGHQLRPELFFRALIPTGWEL